MIDKSPAKWSDNEDELLIEEYSKDTPVAVIATMLGRTKNSVRNRALAIHAERPSRPRAAINTAMDGSKNDVYTTTADKQAIDSYQAFDPNVDVCACRFCGQCCFLDSVYYGCTTRAEAEEQATRNCRCSQAQAYTRKRSPIENATGRINKLLDTQAELLGFTRISDPQIIELLIAVAERLADDDIVQAATFQMGRSKVKIALDIKGTIKVSRTETTSYQLEE